jgi:hypothetical protein
VTVDSRMMLHPKVLECFGAEKKPDNFGITDVYFPSMLKAAQWVELWARESGKEPDVSLMSHGPTLKRPVILTVRGT